MYSRLPSMTVEVVGREISWYCGDTMATGGRFLRGSAKTTHKKLGEGLHKPYHRRSRPYLSAGYVSFHYITGELSIAKWESHKIRLTF